jgi:uncharacterized protein
VIRTRSSRHVGSYSTVTADQPGPIVASPPDQHAGPDVASPGDGPLGLPDLLRLQDIDTASDRLLARQALLEGGAEVAQAKQDLTAFESGVGELQLSIDEVAREQLRLEHDVDSMDHKRRDEEKRLYDGSVANARELQAIRAEVDNIASRTTRLEDRLLELMEQREELDGRLATAREETAAARAVFEELTKGSGDELAEIDRTLAAQTSAREALVPSIDEELLALYHDIRRQKKGVGVAELRDGVCQGCHQKLSPMELDRIKRTSGVRRCDYCRRILVIV